MGRPNRNFVAGYPVHVVQRGNGRQDIFRCDGDRRYMWHSLTRASAEFDVAVNAYVFMTNHVHLMLTPPDERAISRMMQWATRRYTVYFNTRYQRTGTLWEGRFRAFLITRDAYLLSCHRYIDMNPVRASIVSMPGDYAWSSHRFYAHGEPDSLVTEHPALSCLGDTPVARRRRYSALFEQPLNERELKQIRDCVNSGHPIGESRKRRRPYQQGV